jgi:glycosyltransferase involved in cell wall biosynthesis
VERGVHPVKVGVLVPVRNCIDMIETCLMTIMDQLDGCGLEVGAYVVDDASTDGTYEFLAARTEWYSALSHRPDRVGWPAALNRAAEMAIADGCDALFVMNADDFLRLDCIVKCADALDLFDCDFVIPPVQQIGGENVVQVSLPDATLGDFRDHTPIVAFCLVRSSVWEAVGGYHLDVNLPSHGYPPGAEPLAGHNEMDFYIRLLKGEFQYHVLATSPLVYYRMHPSQLHRQVVRHGAEALELIRKKHPEVLTVEPSREDSASD